MKVFLFPMEEEWKKWAMHREIWLETKTLDYFFSNSVVFFGTQIFSGSNQTDVKLLSKQTAWPS